MNKLKEDEESGSGERKTYGPHTAGYRMRVAVRFALALGSFPSRPPRRELAFELDHIHRAHLYY